MNKNIVPQLSEDISYHPFGKTDFFIHQLTFDHRIKISSDLYRFLELIDGKKSLQILVDEYNLKFESILTIDFANDFLFTKLAKYGIIQSDEIEVKPNQKPDYLKLSFILIDVKIVSKFTKYLKYLFLNNVLKINLVIIFLILTICFYTFYNQIFYTNIAKSEWLIFFLMSFVGVTFHEFGHASAAHYYGAKHGGIGGGFYLVVPVYFADVTDIWKLPKSQRIVVNLAGIYFEFVYAIFLIAIGVIFQYNLLILLACIYSLSILRNLNPFARSDGYWVLSDAIEKPNLMHHGFQKIKQIFTSGNSIRTWKAIDYFLLFYGLVNYSFISFFVYIVLIKNPDSIIYFPQNLWRFITTIMEPDSQFSVAQVGKLFLPLLFFYLVFKWLRIILIKAK
jgi:putative peptide zinc metalloprotease protein